MYGVLRQYKVDPSAIDEIMRRASEGFVPLVSSAPGFVSYYDPRRRGGGFDHAEHL